MNLFLRRSHGRRKPKAGGRRGRVPRSAKFRGRPPRFENKRDQIRCLFQFLGYFGVSWPPTDDSSPTRKFVATPLGETDTRDALTDGVTWPGKRRTVLKGAVSCCFWEFLRSCRCSCIAATKTWLISQLTTAGVMTVPPPPLMSYPVTG